MKVVKEKVEVPQYIIDEQEDVLIHDPVLQTLALSIRDEYIKYSDQYEKRHGYKPCSGFFSINHTIFEDLDTETIEMLVIELNKEFPINFYGRCNEDVKKGVVVKTLGVFW